MADKISRREAMKVVAGAASGFAGAHWVFRVTDEGKIVKAQSAEKADWTSTFFTDTEAKQLAALCEAIIPRTDTPGARDARVHEYIDLEMSVEPAPTQQRFRDGLAWMNAYCREQSQHGLAEATEEEVSAALGSVSDTNGSIAEELKTGAAFFIDLKARTIFGYYTSREGWVEELGRPEHVGMSKWMGCRHSQGAH